MMAIISTGSRHTLSYWYLVIYGIGTMIVLGVEGKWHVNDDCCLGCGSLHTLCRFKTLKYGAACIRPKMVDSQPALEKQVEKFHNKLRNSLSSEFGATSLWNMKWDRELAISARRWAMQCLPENDLCRDKLNTDVGQLISMRPSSTLDPTQEFETVISGWFSPVNLTIKRSTKNPTIFFRKTKSVSFNQVMANSTHRVGCGAIYNFCKNGSRVLLIVCNYAPLSVNEILFRRGLPCEDCPKGTICGKGEFPLLCNGSIKWNSCWILMSTFLAFQLIPMKDCKYCKYIYL